VGRGADFGHRSRVVSFDRPYKIGDGAGDFLGNEFPLVSLVESLGLDVTYVTNIDLHQRPDFFAHHKGIFSLGHDEYYSRAMRKGLEDARDHGVNLAFLGANAVYRHIRFAPSPTGDDRHEICYKVGSEDPLTGKDNADVTVDWRDPPNNEPESTLIGDYYQCNPVQADMVVANASNWLFAGTGVQDGQHLLGVVKPEYDRYDPNAPGPPNVEVLTHSPVICHGKHDYSDATYYSAPSGAGVFASGTIAWIVDLDPKCTAADCPGPVLIKVTENLLAAFGSGPAGKIHPSTSNYATLPRGQSATGSGGGTASTATTAARSSSVPPTTQYRAPTTTSVTHR
jgi:hypothetical protein